MEQKAPRIFWMQAKLKTIALQAQLDSKSPLPDLEKLSKLFENQPYLHLIHQQEARYLMGQEQDSLVLKYYDKSLQSPLVDSSTRRANYRELADYYFLKGGYVKTGAYLDSLLREIPEQGRLKTNTQRERDGLDEVIALEQVIRSTDSILSLAAMSKEEQMAYFQKEIDEKRAKELAAIENEKKGFFGFGNNPGNIFYFYNERLVVQGKQAFLSTWGNRPNADNWNRLNNVNLVGVEEELTNQQNTKKEFFIETPAFYVEQIPTDKLALEALANDRKQAYLDVGILYKEKFKNNDLAYLRLEKALASTQAKLNTKERYTTATKFLKTQPLKKRMALNQYSSTPFRTHPLPKS